ncbi:hypothetical protein VPHK460_0104 [Vibrio phage K460]
MNKVELAKMLGLETTGYPQTISKYSIYDLISSSWCVISETFTSGIEIEIEQEDLSKNKLDIKLSDLEKDEDIKVCIKQIEDLLWERATDQYLEKIKNLVETIKV